MPFTSFVAGHPRTRRILGRVALVGAGILAGIVLVVALRTPRLDRTWDPDVRVLAGVEELPDGRIHLTDVRDWSYGVEELRDSTTWFDATYDPAAIVEVWMYEQILDGRGLIAHTFLVFEFGEESPSDAGSPSGPEPGPRYLGLSVETRREVGEQYSIVGGMLRRFEITHIWATEEDLVRRRVEYLDYPLTRYRLEIPPEVRARIFRQFARETGALAATPRWYNTVLNNCTSSLVRYVNESESGAIPLDASWALTGLMDEHLAGLGFLDRASAVHIDRRWLAAHPLREPVGVDG